MIDAAFGSSVIQRETEDVMAIKSDNTTPVNAAEFDKKVLSMMPYYDQFYVNALDVIKTYVSGSARWLDLGCGTGTLECMASEMFDDVSFVMLDISEAMLDQAKEKCAGLRTEYVCASSADIAYENEFDVVTAIQSHHYLHEEERKKAVEGAYKALKDDGIFVAFEIITVEDEAVNELEFKRWESYELAHGRSEEVVKEHLSRAGIAYFPITVEQHIQLLKQAGFRHVRVFWTAYMVMGIYGIK